MTQERAALSSIDQEDNDLLLKAREHHCRQEFEAVVQATEELLQTGYYSAETHMLQGHACEVLGDTGLARLAYRCYAGLAPDSPDAAHRLGRVLFAEQRFQEACEWLELAAFLGCRSSLNSLLLGEGYFALGELYDAGIHLAEARIAETTEVIGGPEWCVHPRVLKRLHDTTAWHPLGLRLIAAQHSCGLVPELRGPGTL